MDNMSWIEIVYWGSTIIGGTLFLLRTIMLLVGGGIGHDDFDPGLEPHMETDLDHSGTAVDSDFSFKMLSMQGITAFFMMFGLVGLAILRTNAAIILSVAGGTAAGLLAVWIISFLFAQMKRLQSEGTLDLQNAVGASGSVYLVIPKEGSGQVQVPVQGSLRIFDAVSADKKMIRTGEKIQVVGVVDQKTLVVEKKV